MRHRTTFNRKNMETTQQTTKTCSHCHRELPLEMFYKMASSKDGLQHQCKECQKENSRNSTRKKSSPGGVNPLLADYTPRELMLELKARGYTGELKFVKIINIENL